MIYSSPWNLLKNPNSLINQFGIRYGRLDKQQPIGYKATFPSHMKVVIIKEGF